ncbi:hypothetical protein BDZ89DRAFT_1152733 [Hymenopellis radicata]|nr:hypothetical protein BDZ89DRAFT_1152733 [Hymenopellis radicata]
MPLPGTYRSEEVWFDDYSLDKIAPFALGALLPVLRTVVIRSTEAHTILFRWLHTLMGVFPLCPSLKKFELALYMNTPVGVVEKAFKHPFIDWTLMLEARYPSLEVVEFELMIENQNEANYTFEDREHLETVIKQEVKFGKSKQLIINWCE